MRKKRALILTGAGASVAFGASSTARLTRCVERMLLPDDWMWHTRGDRAWCLIRDTLEPYLKDLRDGVPSDGYRQLRAHLPLRPQTAVHVRASGRTMNEAP